MTGGVVEVTTRKSAVCCSRPSGQYRILFDTVFFYTLSQGSGCFVVYKRSPQLMKGEETHGIQK